MPDEPVPPGGFPFTYPIPGRPPPSDYVPPDIAAPATEPEPPDVRFPPTEGGPNLDEFDIPPSILEDPTTTIGKDAEGEFYIETEGGEGVSEPLETYRRPGTTPRQTESPLPEALRRLLPRRVAPKSPRGGERARPRDERETLGRRRGAAPTFGALPRPRGLPQPSYSASEVYASFRGPRPRPPRNVETEPFPVIIPRNLPFPIFRRKSRPAPGRTLEQILRDTQRIPLPSPDEMAPYPVLPPRTPPSRVETPVELPEEPLRVPMPKRLPDAPYPQTAPLPPAAIPPATFPPSRNVPPARRRPAPTRPRPVVRPARVGTRIAATVLGASILRPILRRKNQESLSIRDLLQTTPQSQTVTLPDVIQPGEVRDRFGEILEPGLSPEILDLTRPNTRALGFASTVPQARRQKADECVCEKTEEEEEEDRELNRSNVVAQVKTFRRRMSQNSLDNLKKG